MSDPLSFMARAVAVLLAIVVHEFAHGWMADQMGDPTPRSQGRLTLNPLAHLDPVGTFMLLFFRFGWAKPVPINPGYFRDRRRGMVLVAIAGPLANLVVTFIAIVLWKWASSLSLAGLARTFLSLLMQYNLWFALFNLLPVPPLDGSRLLQPYLRGAAARFYYQYQQYGFVVMVLLVASGIVGAVLTPVASAILRLFDRLTAFI